MKFPSFQRMRTASHRRYGSILGQQRGRSRGKISKTFIFGRKIIFRFWTRRTRLANVANTSWITVRTCSTIPHFAFSSSSRSATTRQSSTQILRYVNSLYLLKNLTCLNCRQETLNFVRGFRISGSQNQLSWLQGHNDTGTGQGGFPEANRELQAAVPATGRGTRQWLVLHQGMLESLLMKSLHWEQRTREPPPEHPRSTCKRQAPLVGALLSV